MTVELVTGNHAAGYALSRAAEANRAARGAACGIYPITPQTEIVEYIAKFQFTKGDVVAVESEHSAMGVAIGAALGGARAFTASSSNGLAYMTENVMVAGFYRLPVVMVAVNRTLGPPWNIWADQGDTLMMRDFPWIQLYCESNQEVLDTTLLAFRLGEDRRIMLPVMVMMDAFIVSHTQMETDLPPQGEVDRYLPLLDLPHRMRREHPTTMGGLVWPAEAMSERLEIDEAMERVPGVLEECREAFAEVFGRTIDGAVEGFATEDAELLLVTSGTIATTAREVVKRRRQEGQRVGLLKVKLFRPFPQEQFLALASGIPRIGVLDRNYAAGAGGVFCQEARAAFQGHQPSPLIQGYLTGVCGGDVTPAMIDEVIDDLAARGQRERALWMGIDRERKAS